jgi:hypothetical protein
MTIVGVPVNSLFFAVTVEFADFLSTPLMGQEFQHLFARRIQHWLISTIPQPVQTMRGPKAGTGTSPP